MNGDRRWPLFPVAALCVIVAAGLLCGYWWFFPKQVVTIVNPTRIQTHKKTYGRGEQIVYMVNYCKTREVVGRMTRSLVNGIEIPFAPIGIDLQIGCKKVLFYDLKVPDFMPPGTHHIAGILEYPANPLQKSRSEWRTEDFEVVDSPTGPNEEIKDLRREIEINRAAIEKHHAEDKAWQRRHE
jgi:hypothetical protein